MAVNTNLKPMWLNLCDVFRVLITSLGYGTFGTYGGVYVHSNYILQACQVRVYHRRLRSLLWCLCDVFRALITSLGYGTFGTYGAVYVHSNYILHACQVRVYHRRLRSLLLCLCDVFRALINSLVCCFGYWSSDLAT